MAKTDKALISFDKNSKNEYDFLCSKKNKSSYIVELIKRDMSGNKDNRELDIDVIKQAVREVLSEVEFVGTVKPSIEEDFTDEITNLFNL